MLNDIMSEQDLTKYNTCAKICGIIMSEIIAKIQTGEILNTRDLNEYGDNRVIEECSKIYKREIIKGIAFPTSISLNNCVSNYIYEDGQDEFNTIKDNDVIKIDLGVNLSGCISVLGETIIYKAHLDLEGTGQGPDGPEIDKRERYLQLLEELSKCIPNLMIPGNTNDDVKIIIESKCTEVGCFPVENTVSYEHLDGQIRSFESKYIITNYKKYYDKDDCLTVEENVCFELERGDVYTINLTIIPNDYEQNDETTHLYKQYHDPHIYRFNDDFKNLRVKMSRDFYTIAKKQHGTNAFNCIPYKNDCKKRVGIKHCLENGLLEQYPILYSKDNLPVFTKKFTLIVGDDKCVLLKYKNK
jgi:methionine aminopeptidase